MTKKTAIRLKSMLRDLTSDFPGQINVMDWTGGSYALGNGETHWRGIPLELAINTEAAGVDLLALRPLRFLERFLAGEVDMAGNLYLLSSFRNHANMTLTPAQMLWSMGANLSFLFQNRKRARVNVKNHYDIPQEALDVYLDRRYRSYSCAMFESPDNFGLDELIAVGTGATDNFDSLEKAQWRKYSDATSFLNPADGESVLDIGCGYGGQLQVLLEESAVAKVVGWTHSANQARGGRATLREYRNRDWELNEGDYRQETRFFDHVASTGMVSHVGPRGLVPYVRNVRSLIRAGGHYLHHALMNPYMGISLDREVGIVFNKKYVWPGFHWFTYGDHVKALEENGFEVLRSVNLSPHYAKTTAAWYERMMQQAPMMKRNLGDSTFRAWQIYLSGASEGFRNGVMHVYRLYCRAR